MKRTRLRRHAAVWTLVPGLCATLACSAKHDPAGGILLAVDTNLKVPDDIDGIGISVTSADGTKVTTDLKFPLAPAGDAKFPATLAIVHGTSAPIDIRAVGYKGDTVIALRDAVTQLPSDHTAILRLELNWLDAPLVTGTMVEAVHQVATTCPAMQTPIGGACSSFLLDSTLLPEYDAATLVPSDPTAAVSVATCFAGATTVTADPAACTFAPPPGVTDATDINVGLRPASSAVGWCGSGSCVIPLPEDASEGWSLGKDGLIHLPIAACGSAVAAIVVAPTSASCPGISPAHPVAQVYPSAGSAQSDGGPDDDGAMTLADGGRGGGDAGNDATTTSTDGGPDGSSAEGGAPPPPIFLKHPGVLSIATDATHLFVLSNGGMTIEVFAPAFQTSDTATPIMVSGLQTSGYPESTAAYPFFATINSTNQTCVVNVGDPNTLDEVDDMPASSSDPTLDDLGNGSFELGWMPGFGVSEVEFAGTALPANTANADFDDDAYALALDPTCAAANPCYASSGENDDSEYYLGYGTLGTFSRFQTNLGRSATQFAFPLAGGHLAWSDSTGAIYLWNGATWSAVEPVGTVTTVRRGLAASSGRLFWIGGASSSLFTATVDPSGTVGVAEPVVSQGDGGVASGVKQVIVQGSEVLWFDGAGIYRQDTTLLR